MSHQYSVAVNNGRLDAIEGTIGASPLLRLYTGSAPANCAAAPTGSTILTMNLPSDAFASASAGAKSKNGTWSGTATQAGTAGYYRILDNGGTTCHIQGSVGVGSGELQLDNNVIGNGQVVTISTYQITAANT